MGRAMLEGFYEDRVSRRLVPVELTLDAGMLRIAQPDGRELDRWNPRTVAVLPAEPDGRPRFALAVDAHAALLVEDAGRFTALLQQAGGRAGKAHRRRREVPLLIWIGGATASTLLLAFFVLPMLAGILAPMIPEGVQRRLGDQVADLATMLLTQSTVARECVDPAGKQALDKLRALLPQSGVPDFRLRVIQVELPNAFAVPGHIVVTDGILKISPSPEAALAVMGHELGHIVYGHSMERVMRYTLTSTLVSLVIGDFGGGFMAVAVGRMVEAGFSQDQERQADTYAAQLLHQDGYSARSMAMLFEKMRAKIGDEGKFESWLGSHPQLSERIASLRAQPEPQPPAAEPALTAREWRALQGICATLSNPPVAR
ncbi:M48 family metallopeptidase [Niveispirillum sp. SYP-B3756]|uniref:M48 family metallopeptidase n=1 Tax=Niveispirillum sp. SYP-B3756 TaxID=2662178 RepID=UPI001566CFAC|nr:M48 family metallopeptidase [Niveispirillum sp. SYP-B3756]